MSQGAGTILPMAQRNVPFKMVSEFEPAGDQPGAVAALSQGIANGERYQTLLGITGSGKSATIAWTIEQVQKPTLVIAPNKSLAAQLANMRYDRNDMNLTRGTFRVRGDTIELHPAYDETAVRIELFGDEIERMTVVDPLTGEHISDLHELALYPNSHYV